MGKVKTPSKDSLKASEAMTRAQELAKEVTFNLNATKVGWLQWLIYLCSGGQKPMEQYTSPTRKLL